MDHIGAMQKCRAFDAVAADVEQVRRGLGCANSTRCWIENEITKAFDALEGKDDEVENEPPEEV